MSETQLLSSLAIDAEQQTSQEAATAPTAATADDAASSSFASSSAQLIVVDHKFQLRVLKMNGSTLLFVCNAEPECMDEMGVAMSMPNSGETLATTVLGPSHISDSQRLAEKLSKRFRRQFFVSYNVQLDRISAPLLERHLSDYVRSHESDFA